MYGHRTRRIKTDRRDVAALTEACQRGTYRLAHRRSAHQHAIQCQLNVRKELTQAGTRAISVARAITRAAGFRIRSGRTETFLTRLSALDVPDSMKATLAPLYSLIEVLDDEFAAADDRFAAIAAADPCLLRLMTLPGIGPITACAFVAALDDAARFRGARQVTSYLGLTRRVQLRRTPTARSNPAKRTSAPAVVAGTGGLANVEVIAGRHRRAAVLGTKHCAPPWNEDRDRRVGSAARAHSLCHVAGSDLVLTHASQGSRARIRHNGVHVVDKGLTLGSSSWGSKHECGAWPLSRAVPQRVLLLL